MAYVPPHRRRRSRDAAAAVDETRPDLLTGAPESATATATTPRIPVSRTLPSVTSIRCINLQSRPEKWIQIQQEAVRVSQSFAAQMQRFPACTGGPPPCPPPSSTNSTPTETPTSFSSADENDVQWEWDATNNARYSARVIPGPKILTPGERGCARSHVALWRELVHDPTHRCSDNGDARHSSGGSSSSTHDSENGPTMLVLEDDVSFTSHRGQSRFEKCWARAWEQLPRGNDPTWGILYLGFSDRGARVLLERDGARGDCPPHRRRTSHDPRHPTVHLYRPEYGFHTHAYIITQAAAALLLDQLPVVGPIDVWLADNQWFGIPTFCAVIANEGWRRDDGTYEGAPLVRQNRGRHTTSDIVQSSGR
jgi:GR25 family glycosyltransferase involved in LPS biosynthesis